MCQIFLHLNRIGNDRNVPDFLKFLIYWTKKDQNVSIFKMISKKQLIIVYCKDVYFVPISNFLALENIFISPLPINLSHSWRRKERRTNIKSKSKTGFSFSSSYLAQSIQKFCELAVRTRKHHHNSIIDLFHFFWTCFSTSMIKFDSKFKQKKMLIN